MTGSAQCVIVALNERSAFIHRHHADSMCRTVAFDKDDDPVHDGVTIASSNGLLREELTRLGIGKEQDVGVCARAISANTITSGSTPDTPL